MININVEFLNNNITIIQVSGHANYANKGFDIVCSAVSAITIGGINALLNANKTTDYSIKDGLTIIKTKLTDLETQTILKTLLIQFESIENSYGNYLKITKKYGGA